MTLDVQQLALLGLLSASTHWIVARSKIARPLWSRARGWLGALLACPACSGFWLGLAFGAVGVRPVAGLPHRWHDATAIAVAGLLAVMITPVFEAVLLWGLERSAIPDEPPAPSTAFAEPASDSELEAQEADRLTRTKLGLRD